MAKISQGHIFCLGLTNDGKVLAYGNNEYGQCDVSEWTDIVDIAAGSNFSLGLKVDGTVVATGNNDSGQCDVSGWKDIICIEAKYGNSFGIDSSGRLYVGAYDPGWHTSRYSNFELADLGLTDIVCIAKGNGFVAVRADGRVIQQQGTEIIELDMELW